MMPKSNILTDYSQHEFQYPATPKGTFIETYRDHRIYLDTSSLNVGYFYVGPEGTTYYRRAGWTYAQVKEHLSGPQAPDIPVHVQPTPTPDLITISALDDRRPEWEAAYQNKQMTYAQYLAIFNAYNALYRDLSNRVKYDAYLAALGAPRTPVSETTTTSTVPCFFAYIGETIKPVYLALPAIRRFRDRHLTGAFASLTLQYYEFSSWIVPWIGKKHKYLHPLV